MYPMFYPPFPPMIPNLFKLRNDYPEPPMVYSILNSYVNFGKEESELVKIANLAKTGRAVFFDFEYPLSTHISKEDFETMILNKFLMRRIGYETVTAFKIALNVKLNEIMPVYNKLFDTLDGWNLFTDGESITRTQTTTGSSTSEDSGTNSNTTTASGTDSNTTTDSGTASNTADLRSSNTPQNHLADVRDGSYVSEYNYNQENGTSSNQSQSNGTSSNQSQTSGTVTNSNESTNSGSLNESITRTPADKLAIYREFIEARTGIYTMIFDDLNCLFYNIY